MAHDVAQPEPEPRLHEGRAVETRAWLKLVHDVVARSDGGLPRRPTAPTSVRRHLWLRAGPNVPEPVAAWIIGPYASGWPRPSSAPGIQPRPLPLSSRRDRPVEAGPTTGGDDAALFSTGYTVLQNRPSSWSSRRTSLKDYRTRVLARRTTRCAALIAEVNRDPSAPARGGAAVRSAGRRAPGRCRCVSQARDSRGRRSPSRGSRTAGSTARSPGPMRIIYGTEPKDWVMSWPRRPAVTRRGGQAEGLHRAPLPGPRRSRRSRGTGCACCGCPKRRRSGRGLPAHRAGLGGRRRSRGITPSSSRPRFLRRERRVTRRARCSCRWISRAPPSPCTCWSRSRPTRSSHGASSTPSSSSKEYAEAYVLEKVARDMLAKDPKLKAEFDKALEDPAFAARPEEASRFLLSAQPLRRRASRALSGGTDHGRHPRGGRAAPAVIRNSPWG